MPKNSSRRGSALVVVRMYRTKQDREERSESVAASWTNTSALSSITITIFIVSSQYIINFKHFIHSNNDKKEKKRKKERKKERKERKKERKKEKKRKERKKDIK